MLPALTLHNDAAYKNSDCERFAYFKDKLCCMALLLSLSNKNNEETKVKTRESSPALIRRACIDKLGKFILL